MIGKNKWKILFLSLLSLNIVIVATIFIIIFKTPDYEQAKEMSNKSTHTDLQVIANNKTVENVINKYIKSDDMMVNIDDKEIVIHLKYPVLGKKISIDVQVDPVIQNDKIILNLVNIDILNLPVSTDYFYSFLQKYITLEEGLSYSDEEKAIIVDSKIFTRELDMDVTINKIDYKNDSWYFSIDNLFKD